MEDLFSTSKTNWLELETDVAKTTNAAIEEVQKKNAEIFAMAIAEAKRAEEQKSKNYQTLMQLIGKSVKLGKGLQEWHDTEKENEEYKKDEEQEPSDNVIPPGSEGENGGDDKREGDDKKKEDNNENKKRK